MARVLDSIRNRFIVFILPGGNSQDAFGFTTATHKPCAHVHVTSHPDPSGAVQAVRFLESIPPDLPIYECIHGSIYVCNRMHPVRIEGAWGNDTKTLESTHAIEYCKGFI